MNKIVKYEHHGTIVSVREDLKGKHREHCLCYSCALFVPEDRDKNCFIADRLFMLNVIDSVTTPVWECKTFQPRNDEPINRGDTEI